MPSSESNCVNVSINKYRQFLVVIVVGFLGLSSGMTTGHSAVLLPQLKDDESFPYDTTYDSWVAAITPLSMVLGCICAGSLVDRIGRRLSLILLIIPFVAGWVIQGTATNINLILLGRFLTGLCTGASRPMSLVYLSEVTDPHHRSTALICTSLSMNLGVLTSHVLGTYIYWKLSLLIFCAPVVLSFVLLIYLKESPLWMISKGKYISGIEVFQWYRSKTDAADKELENVLDKQKKSEEWSHKAVFNKPFFKALIISTVLLIAIQFCGVNTIVFYASDILESTFSENVDVFLIMVIIDMIRVCATMFLFFGVKCISRRFLFLLCSFGTAIVLLGLISYTYFKSFGYVWLGLTSMIIYITLSSILVSTAWSFPSEIYANNVRGLGSSMTSLISNILLFIVVKITPGIILSYGMGVIYIGNAIITFVCSVILCFILPETNEKSLQEIEDSLNDHSNSTNVESEQNHKNGKSSIT